MASRNSIGGTVVPHLLQQMTMMMQAWRGGETSAASLVEYGATASGVEEDMRGANIETCRGVLKLYTSAAGAYEPLLSRMHEFLFQSIEHYRHGDDVTAASIAARARLARGGSVAAAAVTEPAASQTSITPPATAAIVDRTDPKTDRAAYAMVRVERTEGQMKDLALEARTREAALEEQIAQLSAAKKRLEGLLEYQIERFRKREGRDRMKADELTREIDGVELSRRLENEQQVVRDREDDIAKLTDRIANLLQLNGMYARQVVELGARIQVYAEQNDKFATLLSLQHDEKLNTDRENDLLRAELMELHKFHQLRDSLEGDSSTVTQSIELRGVRMGRGANNAVPRHLQYKGLMNRFSVPKEAALAIVSDALIQRHAGDTREAQQRRDFSTFIHLYFTKKYGNDAVGWAYCIDEATQFFDGDVNLNLFGLVSRRQLSEQIFRDISTDIQMLMEGCEIMDALQHGDVRLSVPVKHVLGLLVEMYPTYPDPAFKRIMEYLQQSLTVTGHAHYRMLFPNLEREEVSQHVEATFSSVELRKESMFSATFKELLIDDACVSVQAIEDAIMDTPKEMVTLSDMLNATQDLYESDDVRAEVHAAIRFAILDHLGSSGTYEVTVAKHTACSVIRSKIVVRRGVFRFDSTVAGPARLQALMLQVMKSDVRRLMEEHCAAINYLDVLQRLKHRRTTYRDSARPQQGDADVMSDTSDTSPLFDAIAAGGLE